MSVVRSWVWGCVLIGLAATAALADDEKKPLDFEPTSSYTADDIEGFPVRISGKLVAEAELCEAVKAKVRLELLEVKQAVPAPAVKRLQAYPIWLELKTKGAAQFHPDRGWLVANGFNPEKVGNVEVSDAKYYLGEPDYRRTNILLHELAHAYHFHVLGHGTLDVIRAFDRAKQSGRYEKVLHDSGRETRHYGLNNQFEFFAETSESLLWVNDFYPFVRAEYQQVDPEGAAALLKLWREPPATPTHPGKASKESAEPATAKDATPSAGAGDK